MFLHDQLKEMCCLNIKFSYQNFVDLYKFIPVLDLDAQNVESLQILFKGNNLVAC